MIANIVTVWLAASLPVSIAVGTFLAGRPDGAKPANHSQEENPCPRFPVPASAGSS